MLDKGSGFRQHVCIMTNFLTTSEAARELGLTPATVRHLERSGKLAALRSKNGTRIFSERDVEQLKAIRAAAKANTGRGE